MSQECWGGKVNLTLAAHFKLRLIILRFAVLEAQEDGDDTATKPSLGTPEGL